MKLNGMEVIVIVSLIMIVCHLMGGGWLIVADLMSPSLHVDVFVSNLSLLMVRVFMIYGEAEIISIPPTTKTRGPDIT